MSYDYEDYYPELPDDDAYGEFDYSDEDYQHGPVVLEYA